MKSVQDKVKYEIIPFKEVTARTKKRLAINFNAMSAVMRAIRDHIKHEISKK